MKWRDYILPTRTNDYVPKLLQKTAVVLMFGLVLLSFATVNLQTLFWQSSSWLVGAILPAVVVDLTNAERAKEALVPLRRSQELDEAARLKAEHMAQLGYFAHYSPAGVSPWHWFDQVSYRYAYAGENLAIHFTDSIALVDAWMNSPAHQANIANRHYTEIGIGTARGQYEGLDTVYVVQLFGTPAASTQSASLPLATATSDLVSADNQLSRSDRPVVAAGGPTDDVLSGTPTTSIGSIHESVAGAEAGKRSLVAKGFIPIPATANPAPTNQRPPVVLVSGHLSTSSGLLPAIMEYSAGTTASASFFGTVATSPSKLLQLIYLTLGFLVVTLLVISMLLGIRYERPLQVAYGIGLLIMMTGLFYLHSNLTSRVVIAAEPTETIMVQGVPAL